MSAVRRSSMSSCGSSGYFSSSPTLGSSPPVLCNPKSGERPKGSHDCGGLGTRAGCVPREADSQSGRLVRGNLVTACSWGQAPVNGREAHRFGQRENWAALTPGGALETGWPFRIVPNWNSTLLTPNVNQSLDVGCAWEEGMTLGKAAPFRGRSKDS